MRACDKVHHNCNQLSDMMQKYSGRPVEKNISKYSEKLVTITAEMQYLLRSLDNEWIDTVWSRNIEASVPIPER